MELKDFLDLLEELQVEFHQNHSHIILKNCPNCGGRDKLMIYKKNLLWQCWKCKGLEQEHSKGNLYQLLLHVLGLDKTTIKTILGTGEKIIYTSEEFRKFEEENHKPKETTLKKFELPSNWVKLDCSFEQMKRFKEVYKYLIDRKITSEKQILDFELRYDPATKRIIFPIFYQKDYCVGYQGRDITNRWKIEHPKCENFKCSLYNHYYFIGERQAPKICPACGGNIESSFYPKAINSRNFPKTELFFNQQNIDWRKPVTIVEGPFDAINTRNAMALLGRTLSETQLIILIDALESMKNLHLKLFLDGDSAGTFSTNDIYRKVSGLIPKIEMIWLEDGDDPGAHSLSYNDSLLVSPTLPQDWYFRKKKLF